MILPSKVQIFLECLSEDNNIQERITLITTWQTCSLIKCYDSAKFWSTESYSLSECEKVWKILLTHFTEDWWKVYNQMLAFYKFILLSNPHLP